jgi:uncharacterized OsmC-like protein
VKITLLSDDRIRYEPTSGPLTVEAPDAATQYSPFHMLGSSLAACTFSVLQAWASRAGIATDDLVLEASWRFADKPHRVEQLGLEIVWPSLPASRLEAAKRAAALCTVHVTLEHPPTLPVIVSRGASEDAASAGVGAGADAAPADAPVERAPAARADASGHSAENLRARADGGPEAPSNATPPGVAPSSAGPHATAAAPNVVERATEVRP